MPRDDGLLPDPNIELVTTKGTIRWSDGDHVTAVLQSRYSNENADVQWVEETTRKLIDPPRRTSASGLTSYPVSSLDGRRKTGTDELSLEERWYPIQVKQKDKAGRPDIDAFEAMMMREKCDKGYFVSFDYSSDAETEVSRFFKSSGKTIVLLTVREILEETLAAKLS